jgi:nucleoside-diphosphate-sugar epimerase
MASAGLPNVAIAGATGRLGKHILSALLSPEFRPSFNEVILLKRGPAPDAPPTAGPEGTTTRHLSSPPTPTDLAHIDVLINAVGPAGHEFKDALFEAAITASASSQQPRLYIPSEFGVDHYNASHDFAHAEWDRKKHHLSLRPSSSNLQVLRIYFGLFLEDSVGPWFGMDAARGRYESIGSADTRVSYTGLDDSGRVVAQVARSRGMVGGLEELHVGGDVVSMREIAGLMAEAGGVAEKEVVFEQRELEGWKTGVIQEGTEDPSKYLRFLMGEGKIEHTKEGLGNDNGIVNPGETVWKWKTMRDYAAEVGGKPWADYKWDDSQVK